jgi:isocitrate dehydrogenase kinase/phosphatase
MSIHVREEGRGNHAAGIIRAAFLDYEAEFWRLTLQARARFESQAWSEVQRDSAARIGLYRSAVRQAIASLEAQFGERLRDRSLWSRIKSCYARDVAGRANIELAETFFNSVTRKIFGAVGLDSRIEFDNPMARHREGRSQVTELIERRGSVQDLVASILRRHRFAIGYDDIQRDARLIAQRIEAHAPRVGVRDIELVRQVFFRNKGAYLVGRIRTGDGAMPMVLALLNDNGRVRVDSVLLDEDEVSVVFSFTHSYFMVAAKRPRELVRFLQTILPNKPRSELYNAIGFNKHGKTELYRSLQQHLHDAEGRFEVAQGEPGMVMIVFTMQSFEYVFKVIRDRFMEPKTTTREQVMQKYRLVYEHDRAGRLVDAVVFEHLRLSRHHFEPGLLAELLEQAADTVTLEDDEVVIQHVYLERRLLPFDIFLEQADADSRRQAVVDYGQAIRDLAATNIFPGDLLLKNFGVTRHQRLVFYDYDELCFLLDCRFRRLPTPSTDEEELAAGAWFYVAPEDVFPEEFLTFLGLRGALRQVFVEHHADLLEVAFWHGMQRRLAAGEVLDVYPYRADRRLHVANPS